MKVEGRWKWRAVDAEENQQQVSLSAHRPWKSLRDYHIPTASTTHSNQIRKEARRRIASLPPSGSFFNEKMLTLASGLQIISMQSP